MIGTRSFSYDLNFVWIEIYMALCGFPEGVDEACQLAIDTLESRGDGDYDR